MLITLLVGKCCIAKRKNDNATKSTIHNIPNIYMNCLENLRAKDKMYIFDSHLSEVIMMSIVKFQIMPNGL